MRAIWLVGLVLLGLTLQGCSTSPAVRRAVSLSELSLGDAEALISAYEHRRELRHAEVASDALGKPRSLDDVLEILRRDQVDFFPEAMKYASQQPGGPSLALQAQLELAWGEADLILDEMLSRSTVRLRAQLNELELKRGLGSLGTDDEAQWHRLRQAVEDLSGLGQALVRVGGHHISVGAKLAQQLIAQSPDDYHGYRVAADYYRLRGDWEHFDEMMAKLAAAKPDSNGLTFLRGIEALQRRSDRAAAQAFFEQALERDPRFARARVQLMLAQTDIMQAQRQLEKLREVSPHHQLVSWVGPAIKVAAETRTSGLQWLRDQRGLQPNP
jgi:tetratricopeptide (TPR) repeat protein